MANPRQHKRAKPTDETLRKIEVARAESAEIERMPDGKEKFAAKKGWYIKHAAILNDILRWENYLRREHDFPTEAAPNRRERKSDYGDGLPP